MKVIKGGLAGVIVALCIMVIYQNAEFLKTTYSLGVDFKLSDAWVFHTPELPNGVFLLITLFVGVIVGYGVTLPGWMRNKKLIRQSGEEVRALRSQVEKLKNRPAPSFSLDSEAESAADESTAPADASAEEKDNQEAATQ
ncbi:LapA family protein [Desulfatibacillum aliphaticivorans]|uniref:LapA family protein n=1 Tax=Desulfatibacillum aliphaticivorans TaxID=218208 RepID=UPI0004021277|nr:LapA family protein [Desulfatibacillum aliphaticivorans]